MMKKFNVFCLVVFCFAFLSAINSFLDTNKAAEEDDLAFANGPMGENSQWSLTYGGGNNDFIESIQETQDGSFIAIGSTQSFGAGSYDGWVLKLNLDGYIAWQKTFGGSNQDYFYKIKATSDNGYIIGGENFSSGAGSSDIWLVKLDANGVIQWQKTYGTTVADYFRDVQVTSNGEFVVLGVRSNANPWIFRLNSNGNILWEKRITNSSYSLEAIQPTSNGDFIAVGNQYSGGLDHKVWVIKMNGSGATLWQKIYNYSPNSYAKTVLETNTGDFIVAADITNTHMPWLIKLDTSGNVIWEKQYEGASQINSIVETEDGSLFIAGTFWAAKLDEDGNVFWKKTYSRTEYLQTDLQTTSDGGFMLTGSAWILPPLVNYSETQKDFPTEPVLQLTPIGSHLDGWVLKLDGNGEINNCDVISSSNLVMTDTLAVVTNTTLMPPNITSTTNNSFLVPQDSFASVGLVCGFIPTPTPTVTSTLTPTLTATNTLTPTATNTLTPTATITPSPTSTETPTLTPTDTLTPTPSPSLTPSPSPTNTSSPTSTNTITPSATNTPTDTPTPSNTPSPTNTDTLTPSPTHTATSTTTHTPSLTPTPPPVYRNYLPFIRVP